MSHRHHQDGGWRAFGASWAGARARMMGHNEVLGAMRVTACAKVRLVRGRVVRGFP